MPPTRSARKSADSLAMRAFMRSPWLWLGIAESRCRPKMGGNRDGMLTLSEDLTRSKMPVDGAPELLVRLVKASKVYWRDSGLLHALLNVSDEGALLAQPWVGASWEGYVIEQAIGQLSARGPPLERRRTRVPLVRVIVEGVVILSRSRWRSGCLAHSIVTSV